MPGLVQALHGWHAGLQVAENRRVGILRIVVGDRLLFSQMATVLLATVPLWKVINWPPRQLTKRAERPVFLAFLAF
jgi:hypothetical protein